jgi:hypothetical protein
MWCSFKYREHRCLPSQRQGIMDSGFWVAMRRVGDQQTEWLLIRWYSNSFFTQQASQQTPFERRDGTRLFSDFWYKSNSY